MVAQRSLKHKRISVKAEKDPTAKNKKIKVKPKIAPTPAKVKERATKSKSNEPLTTAQKVLKTAQGELEYERKARIKAEKDLIEAQEDLVAARRELEQERQARIKRVSFVVRLTVDEHGQLGRAEIEHIPSSRDEHKPSRKQSFLNLDGESLVAFMKACIGPTIIKEAAFPTAPCLEKIATPISEPSGPKSSLIVSTVRVAHLKDLDILTLVLTSEEPFIVQVLFQLERPDTHFLTTQDSSFDVKIYANEVTSGKFKLLTTCNPELVRDMPEYEVQAEVPGLQPGFYRLFTLVTLGTPISAAGCHEGPVIQVI